MSNQSLPAKPAKKVGRPKAAPKRGRQLGCTNKTTRRAREAVALFVEGNVDRLQGWLDQIAEEEGPRAAFKCLTDVMGYHIPKLTRATFVDNDERELVVNLLRFADLPAEEQARYGEGGG